MRTTSFTLAAVLALLLAFAGGAPGQSSASSVVVDPTTTFQTIDNFGSSHRTFDDPHLWRYRSAPNEAGPPALTPAERDQIFDLLYRDAGLTYIRISSDGGLEPKHGTFVYDGRRLDAQIADALGAQARGPVKVAFTLLRYPPESWMQGSVRDYADYFVAVVNRARERGLSIDYLTFNEPTVQPELMRDVIKRVASDVGPGTKWIVPESKRPEAAEPYLRVLLEDAKVRPALAAIGTHLYGDDKMWPALTRMKALADSHGLPLWMSEFSSHSPWDWAALVQRLLVAYGVSAVDYMWGAFGAYDPYQLLILKTAADGRYLGVEPRKQFAVTQQWSRYVRPGARRIGATADDPSLLVSAFASGDWTILVAYNPTTAEKTVTVRMPGTTVERVRTSPTEDLASLPPEALVSGALTATLPASSVTTFVAGAASAPRFPQEGDGSRSVENSRR